MLSAPAAKLQPCGFAAELERQATPVKKKPTPECPQCGTSNPLPIVYGMPGPELMSDAQEGRVALGGCCVGEDDPDLECRACGTRFTSIPARA
jgi:hypothetical protein